MDWWVNLSSWIIQDGNYGDFARDDRAEFAVEFQFDEFERLPRDTPVSARHRNDSTYDLTARVVAMEPGVWVIEAGVLLFNDAKAPDGVEVGDILRGSARLGVDPFFYFERLAQRESVPALIHTWTVRAVLCQTAPFVETVTPGGQRVSARDASKLAWKEIGSTDAWNDDGGNAEYVLRCGLLDLPAKRTSITAHA